MMTRTRVDTKLDLKDPLYRPKNEPKSLGAAAADERKLKVFTREEIQNAIGVARANKSTSVRALEKLLDRVHPVDGTINHGSISDELIGQIEYAIQKVERT
jgi:hypothetical protein